MLDAFDQYCLLHEGNELMSAISAYLIEVICITLLCSIVNHMLKDTGTVSGVVKLLSGVVVTVAILSPLVEIPLALDTGFLDSYVQTGQQYILDGQQLALEEKTQFIKSQSKAYILDKATSLGAELEVEVVLGSKEDIPYEKVLLRGKISPYAKQKLSHDIANDLGIPLEALQWSE